MANLAVLNNIDHKDLRVVTTRSAEHGDAYMVVPTFPREFRSVQAHYPIVFRQTQNGGDITPLVLLGLQPDENLFLGDGTWDAGYIPLCAEAKPFLIGSSQSPLGGQEQWEIHVDLDSTRLSRDRGVSLFGELGGNSPYLNRIREVLQAIHAGIGEVKPFTDALKRYELLEPFTAEMNLPDGNAHRLAGFYTINEERLAQLPEAAICNLHTSGLLFDIHMQLASLSHIADLFQRKSARLAS